MLVLVRAKSGRHKAVVVASYNAQPVDVKPDVRCVYQKRYKLYPSAKTLIRLKGIDMLLVAADSKAR